MSWLKVAPGYALRCYVLTGIFGYGTGCIVPHVDGWGSRAMFLFSADSVVLLVGITLAFWGRPVEIPPGTTVLRGSRTLAVLLVLVIGIWILGCAALAWDGLEYARSTGRYVFTFTHTWWQVAAGGLLGFTPWVWKFATGRLRLWQIDVTPEGIRHRAGRKETLVPWGSLERISLESRWQLQLEARVGCDGGRIGSMLAFQPHPQEIVAWMHRSAPREVSAQQDRRRRLQAPTSRS